MFSGFSNVQNGIVINHLNYADDTIFFLDNSKEELHNLFSVLKCFEFIAGLKINTTKTRLIPIGNCPDLHIWAAELGCITDKIPFIYLGMPLGANASSKEIWKPIIQKFDDKLSLWKQVSVSKGGKLTMLKCILSSLPMYYFSLFKAPTSIMSQLEQRMREFLWEHKPGSTVSHLVRWVIVCASKEKGGLGVLNLMNDALLAKWCWRFGVEKNQLWYKIIAEKYATVASHISTEGNWVFDFKRRLLGSEADQFAALMMCIGDSPPVLNSSPDTRRWSLGNNGVYSTWALSDLWTM